MADDLLGWSTKGFRKSPAAAVAPAGGVLVYRCWGGTAKSTELGTGYFSLEKPTTVSDAELRFNIREFGNLMRFVSTFRIRPGVGYWQGPLFHHRMDLMRPATQVFIEAPVAAKVEWVGKEVLRQDVFAPPISGHVGPIRR